MALTWVRSLVWASVALVVFVGCAAEAPDATEAFVSIEAIEQAREATSVRLQVNAAVVELSREGWPLEVLLRAADEAGEGSFELRAWGLNEGRVTGAAERSGKFRQGKRIGVELVLEPQLDLGPPPAVNAEVGPGGVVTQPDDGVDMDSAVPEVDGGDSADAESDDAQADDAGADADAGELPGCEGDQCVDAGPDACVPGPDECGSCGTFCTDEQQCLEGTCRPIPAPSCVSSAVNGRIYTLCSEARSWSAAREACRSAGSDLVIIDDPTENTRLLELGASTNFFASSKWLGGNDRGESGTTCKKGTFEGLWYWVDKASGAEMGTQFCALASNSADSCTPTSGRYTNWAAGEPNNSGCSCNILPPFKCSAGEDCLTINSAGAWVDVECDEGRGYVCEQL